MTTNKIASAGRAALADLWEIEMKAVSSRTVSGGGTPLATGSPAIIPEFQPHVRHICQIMTSAKEPLRRGECANQTGLEFGIPK